MRGHNHSRERRVSLGIDHLAVHGKGPVEGRPGRGEQGEHHATKVHTTRNNPKPFSTRRIFCHFSESILAPFSLQRGQSPHASLILEEINQEQAVLSIDRAIDAVLSDVLSDLHSP